ncbi:hypothetical protein AFAEC_2214 [Aliarcobacter faecis]|uniref:hypothetical protein n=1 Tax=Aliarcobacter faecis TaxID=1564138 RepID=UPI00047CD1E2|nr:hypothetical protein [Aliarcobacter faecis]QKF74357.1 hypothetical protein AFAEC_2214 [Aliarcobacter faecis]
MSLLQYSSKEMFSATDLVRKNKAIFDKLNSKEIQKAVILRDGKPSAILLDFAEYEKIIEEYLTLKNISKLDQDFNSTIKTKKVNLKSEISDEDYKNALLEIEKIGKDINSENKVDKSEALKDFWNK